MWHTWTYFVPQTGLGWEWGSEIVAEVKATLKSGSKQQAASTLSHPNTQHMHTARTGAAVETARGPPSEMGEAAGKR